MTDQLRCEKCVKALYIFLNLDESDYIPDQEFESDISDSDEEFSDSDEEFSDSESEDDFIEPRLDIEKLFLTRL
ncbi:hypothetical protein FQA39_LY05698 [Lamprigera yunnana]|nr:hypothetical protein FQA39_LY05698 [Lamprigera yunnana]